MVMSCASPARCLARPRDRHRRQSSPSAPSLAARRSLLSFPSENHRPVTRTMLSCPSPSFRCSILRASVPHDDASSLEREDGLAIRGVTDKIVGILRGGQWGRMLCLPASCMGIKVMTLDPLENCPASAVSHRHVKGDFNDNDAVREFSKRCGVLTIEIEHVDAITLEKLEQQGIDCQPKASTIRIIQDKYLQKVHFSKHGIPLLDFMQHWEATTTTYMLRDGHRFTRSWQ